MVTRVGTLRGGRLGHLALEPEVYMCERDQGLHDGHADLFDVSGPVCNEQLVRMWGRLLTIVPGLQANDATPRVPWVEGADIHDLVERSEPHLKFSRAEHQRGLLELARMGVDRPHVCFHGRDQTFLATTMPETDWSYHDYRDMTVANFAAMVDGLADRGYLPVRMGAVVAEPFPSWRAVDYATAGRSDFMDLYLMATCAFAVCSASGVASLASVFRRPLAVVNASPLLTMVWPHFPMCRVFIPKRYWSRVDGRFLTVAEIVASGLDGKPAQGYYSSSFEAAGVELVENSSQEIADVALELEETLATGEPPADPDGLQRAFWRAAGMPDQTRMRVGSAFLLEHYKTLGL